MIPADRRRLSRLLTRLADATVAAAMALVPPPVGACRRIGITGPPGAGKSSLVAKLAPYRIQDDGDLAIVAIDPTSPISGGAILGDRIRMEALAIDPRIYIRSLASRTSVDGLADNLPDILAALEGFGFAEVILETVGVGQVEYAVRNLAETLVLVLAPGAGDQVQVMKSGILETADLFVIHKADQPGTRQLSAELASVLRQRTVTPNGWKPAILTTSVSDPASIERLSAEIARHQVWCASSRNDQQNERRRFHVGSLARRRLDEILRAMPPDMLQEPITAIYDHVAGQLDRRRTGG